MNKRVKKIQIDYTIIGLLSMLCCIGLFPPGIPIGQDIIYELTRVAEYTHSLKNSGFPVRWAANLDGGYGQPIFIFYSPLFLFVSSAQILTGLSVISAVKISLFLFTFLGGIGMYHFANNFFERNGARLASFVFILFPYKFADLYMRNAFAEYTAMSLAPFVFLGLYLISKDRIFNRKSFFLLTISGTFFALSHNLSLLMYAPLFICYYFFNLIFHKNFKGITYGILAAFHIFLLTSFFILPALSETQFIQHSQLLIKNFNVFNNFTTLKILFGFSRWYSLTPLSIIILLAVFASLILKKRSFNESSYASVIFFLSSLAILFFLTTSSSKIIWELFPFLQYIQFPWRLLSPITFIIAFITGSIIHLASKKDKNKTNLRSDIKFSFAIALLIVVASISIFSYQTKHPERFFWAKSDYFSEKNIREQNLKATVLSEYRPIWVSENSTFSDFINTEGDFDCVRKINNINSKTTRSEYFFRLKEKCILILKIHYYPGWQIYANNKKIPVGVDKNGLIVFVLPEGDHPVDIKFKNTTLRTVSETLTIFGIIALCVILIIFIRHPVKTKR